MSEVNYKGVGDKSDALKAGHLGISTKWWLIGAAVIVVAYLAISGKLSGGSTGSTTIATVPTGGGTPGTTTTNSTSSGTTPSTSPMSLGQSDAAFIASYANTSGPITASQADSAVIDAYQVGLGRAPESAAVVQEWGNQIVANQSYGPTLQNIVYSPEGQQDIHTLSASPTKTLASQLGQSPVA